MIRNAVHIFEQTNFPNNFSWLQSAAPAFSMHGDQISILHKPEEFYETLLERCRSAKKRIVLASLYLGTGPMEKEIVDVINCQLKQERDLRVSILLDANRGSRGKENSRTMLLPLLQNNQQCQVSLFHTPFLRGPLKYLLPPRYNELVGLQHIKLYLFDDSILISGANLSEDYFTNRQDRYMLVSGCEAMADFYWELIQRISSVSLGLNATDNLTPRSYHPFKSNKNTYINDAKMKIWKFYKHATANNYTRTEVGGKEDTWIFPLVELPPLGVHQDSRVTSRLLECMESGSQVTLSTGYFNLTDQYTDTILSRSRASYRVLMAHPSANGFLKAGGLAGGIPSAYTGLALNFLRRVLSEEAEDRVSMWEYCRPGWTYHAKGLWYSPPTASSPILTLVGSSNFGSRSVRRDLEMQIALVTTNKSLRDRLKEEEEHLVNKTVPFTLHVASDPERKPPLWILTTMKLFKNFF